MSRILLVEDVEALREQYSYDLRRLGDYETRQAESVAAALKLLDEEPVDCVLLDLEMPGADGFELLKALSTRPFSPPVVVYTGTGDYDRCVRAVKLGAYGFLDKGEPMERVIREIEGAIERSSLRREVGELRRRLTEDTAMVGSSRAMRGLRETIAKLAPIPSPVLIFGESGTGKELVAQELHRLGARPDGPFHAVNSAALPEQLVESELFGHEKGAFTGADRVREGAFEMASGGTLFLDEIGELPGPAQAKLLRVLEEEKVTRVGGSRPIEVRARVIAATNRDLEHEVAEGRFREDLLYRLNVHVVAVPALRDRLTDVEELVAYFLETTARRFGTRPKEIDAAALELLAAYDWRRNNVRELRNVVERLVIATDGETIGADAIPVDLGGSADPPSSGTLKDRKAAAERRIVREALDRNDWHVTRTAEELGLADHASLSKIMKRHGLRKS